MAWLYKYSVISESDIFLQNCLQQFGDKATSSTLKSSCPCTEMIYISPNFFSSHKGQLGMLTGHHYTHYSTYMFHWHSAAVAQR